MESNRTVHVEEDSIKQAVEALSTIADLELSSVIQDPLMENQPEEQTSVMVKTVRWLHRKNAEHILDVVRRNFSTLLKGLGAWYKRDTKITTLPGARDMMMLADEAAEKADRYAHVFMGELAPSVKSSKEFRELCDFYISKIAPLFKTAKKTSRKNEGSFQGERGFIESSEKSNVDLEAMKNDLDYELLWLKKSDGSRFFTPQFIRALKLACDVDKASSKENELNVHHLRAIDAANHVRPILEHSYRLMDEFFHFGKTIKEHTSSELLYAPCIALMEASLQAIHEKTSKGVAEYLDDFRSLLAEEVHSSSTKELFTYPPVRGNSWEYVSLKLSEELAFLLVMGRPIGMDFVHSYHEIIQQQMYAVEKRFGKDDGTLSKWLALRYSALRELVKTSRGSLLSTMLEELREGERRCFEPLVTGSLAHHLCDIQCGEKSIPCVQIPSPTFQERIDEAIPSDLFSMAIRKVVREHGEALIFNFQNHASWKDSARCRAIEEMRSDDVVGSRIFVVSLPRDGEWYSQGGSFANLSSSTQFKKELVNRLCEEKNLEFNCSEKEWTALIDAIHSSVYSNRNILTQVMRCEFIDIVHIFLMVYAIATVRPGVVFLCCKDGLDNTLTAFAGLASFLRNINRQIFSKEDREWLGSVLGGIPLSVRQRAVFKERFHRLISLIRVLEIASEERGIYEDPGFMGCIEKIFPGGIGVHIFPRI